MTDTKTTETTETTEQPPTYPTRDEVFEFLEPRVEKMPFKAEITKEGDDKIVIRQVLYDARLRPQGKADIYTLTFVEGEPMSGYFQPRDLYFGGVTPRDIWHSVCRLIGKPQMYNL